MTLADHNGQLSPEALSVWNMRSTIILRLPHHLAEVRERSADPRDCGRDAADYALRLAATLTTHGAIPEAISLTALDVFDLAKAFYALAVAEGQPL